MSVIRSRRAHDVDMLTLHSVTAGYGETTVLRNVDFTVGDGEVVALLGPNAPARRHCCGRPRGFVKPRSGRVEFGGGGPDGSPAPRLRDAWRVPPARGSGDLSVASPFGRI